jgi:CheY-like chemotaxis protein
MIVVEDPQARYLYGRFLEKNDYGVVMEAESATEAIKKVEESCRNVFETPEFLVTNGELPDSRGIEVAKALLLEIDPDLEAILCNISYCV